MNAMPIRFIIFFMKSWDECSSRFGQHGDANKFLEQCINYIALHQ